MNNIELYKQVLLAQLETNAYRRAFIKIREFLSEDLLNRIGVDVVSISASPSIELFDEIKEKLNMLLRGIREYHHMAPELCEQLDAVVSDLLEKIK